MRNSYPFHGPWMQRIKGKECSTNLTLTFYLFPDKEYKDRHPLISNKETLVWMKTHVALYPLFPHGNQA